MKWNGGNLITFGWEARLIPTRGAPTLRSGAICLPFLTSWLTFGSTTRSETRTRVTSFGSLRAKGPPLQKRGTQDGTRRMFQSAEIRACDGKDRAREVSA